MLQMGADFIVSAKCITGCEGWGKVDRKTRNMTKQMKCYILGLYYFGSGVFFLWPKL